MPVSNSPVEYLETLDVTVPFPLSSCKDYVQALYFTLNVIFNDIPLLTLHIGLDTLENFLSCI